MNDNNKDNHTKAVREGLESLQKSQKQYTMKQISEQTDSKVTPEDVRSEIVKIINDEEGQLLYSPSCESSGICERLRELGSGICERLREHGSGICERLREQIIEIDYTVISYTTVLIGFFLLAVLLIFGLPLGLLPSRYLTWDGTVVAPQISESLASTLLLSSGAFYATIGVYLFSQANTCYSIGADRGNKELYDTGTEISRAGCLVSGGGAVSLTAGIFITIFNFPFPHYSWLKTLGLFVSVLVSQVLILWGLWKHEKQHEWFKDLRKDEFSEEHSGK